MPRIYLLPEKGAFYKANLHGHTVLSDGHLTPEEFKGLYQSNGYLVVAITDHRHYAYHKNLQSESFVCLAAVEMDINTPEDTCARLSPTKGTYHFNLYDTQPESRATGFQPPAADVAAYYNPAEINRWLARMQQLGFMVCYNHPYWSLHTSSRYSQLQPLFAMEIYNHGCEIDGMYGFAPQVYDEMLRAGLRLGCLATDDNHNAYAPGHTQCDALGGFTMLKMPALSYAGVINALQAGHYYASSGPAIHSLFIENGSLHIACSPVQRIYVITEGRNCAYALAPQGETLCKAILPLTPATQYFRVDICNSNGKHACTPAYFLDKLPL